MTKWILTAALALCALAGMAEEDVMALMPKPPKPMTEMNAQEKAAYNKVRAEAFSKLTEEQKRILIRQTKERYEQRTGGHVRRTDVQKGRIVFANAQKAVPDSELAKPLAKLADFLKVAIDVVPAAAPASCRKDAPAFLRAHGANAVVYVVDSEDACALLVAPEDRWALVNVAALRGGDVAARTQKELVRAFAFLCGAGASQFPESLTGPVLGVEQLDAIKDYELPIDVLQRFTEYLEGMGVKPYIQASYRTACRQGWAPAPTNDVQRGIWERVKADKERGPARPLHILPPGAKK